MDINSFIICPKCGSMETGERRTRCGVCNFAHTVIAEAAAELPKLEADIGKATVTVSGDPMAKTIEAGIEVALGEPPHTELVVTPPDPANG